MYDNAPIPPVTSIWRVHHHPSVHGLDQPFQHQIAEFRGLWTEANHPIAFDNPEGENNNAGVEDLSP